MLDKITLLGRGGREIIDSINSNAQGFYGVVNVTSIRGQCIGDGALRVLRQFA